MKTKAPELPHQAQLTLPRLTFDFQRGPLNFMRRARRRYAIPSQRAKWWFNQMRLTVNSTPSHSSSELSD
jgi:hypothetical protein